MQTSDRVGIGGANGLGKSTLIAHLLGHFHIELAHLTHMPQEISAQNGAILLREAKALKNEQLGHAMNVVSRLGSRPQRLLGSAQPSPGELRKLLLALGMGRSPHLIILDEPTNHLDLPSIECLEATLVDCPCAMVIVSHDERLLDHLTTTRWEIEDAGSGDSELIVAALGPENL
jgi:ATPase subunit of ABC transporter with duplicated ATPase domains